MHIHLSNVAFHVLCVGLGFHVVIGVGHLIVRFHLAYVIPSFLLDVVVRLCLVIVNSDCSHNSCILHIAKTGPLKCCPYTSRRLQQTAVSCTRCVGCAIVKGDHAPDCGVAQGVVHGVIGHHGKEEEEMEEELGQEVKGQEGENAQTPVRMTMTMDEMEKTLRGP